MPPVSITSKRRPSCSADPCMRSRVIPGSSPTIARRCPVMRLKRVDFPTLGLPTMTTVGMALDMKFYDSRRMIACLQHFLYFEKRGQCHASRPHGRSKGIYSRWHTIRSLSRAEDVLHEALSLWEGRERR